MTEAIKTVIVENDQLAYRQLTSVIKSLSGINLIGWARSIEEGVVLINSTKPEMVFLDIELDDGLSFEILDHLDNKDFEVIFTTAYNDYYERAIEHFAFHYLLKPIKEKELGAVIDRYRETKLRYFTKVKYESFKGFVQPNSPKVLLNTGKEYVSVLIEDIIYCTADGHYTQFKLIDGTKLLASNVLKYYENLFHHRGFFRASRSHLVNIGQIAKIYKKETIIMNGGDRVHVSLRNRTNLSRLIDTLM